MGRISNKPFSSWAELIPVSAKEVRGVFRKDRGITTSTKMFRKRMRCAKIEAMMHTWTAKYRAKRATK